MTIRSVVSTLLLAGTVAPLLCMLWIPQLESRSRTKLSNVNPHADWKIEITDASNISINIKGPGLGQDAAPLASHQARDGVLPSSIRTDYMDDFWQVFKPEVDTEQSTWQRDGYSIKAALTSQSQSPLDRHQTWGRRLLQDCPYGPPVSRCEPLQMTLQMCLVDALFTAVYCGDVK
jgi:hypothetical protein